MLISLLLRLIATIFVARPPGIEPGQWNAHARYAVRALGAQLTPRPVPRGSVRRYYPQGAGAERVFVAGEEGVWTCKP